MAYEIIVTSSEVGNQKMQIDTLIDKARHARGHAQAPFSKFKVGAALEAADGAIFTGCNIENATLNLGICAERVALFKALSEGHTRFARIAIVADSDMPTPPCGACRQLLWEFGGDLQIISENMQGQRVEHQLKGLFPHAFDERQL